MAKVVINEERILKDAETGIVVGKENDDFYYLHLGNKDFALEISKAELLAFQVLIAEILKN